MPIRRRADCLTTPQVEAVRKIYAGPINPRTNEAVWSPLYRGSELDWSFFTDAPSPIGIATNTLRDAMLKDPAWNYRTSPIDFDRDVALADRSDIARVNASNPDISEYLRRGGKLILSGGWNNALVPAGAVVDYYRRVEAAMGRRGHAPGRSPLHGARDDRMQWRPRNRHIRHARRHATLGGTRSGAERGYGVARRTRLGRAYAPALPLSAGRDVSR